MSFYSPVNSLTNMHRAGAIPALENHSLLIKVRITSSLVLFIICYSHILFFRLRWNTKSDKMLQLAEETRGFVAHFGSSPGRWWNLFCACESFGGEAAILAALSSKTFVVRTIPQAKQAWVFMFDLSEDLRIITDFLVNFLKRYPPNVTSNLKLRRPFVSSNALLKTCWSYIYTDMDSISNTAFVCYGIS